MLDGILLYSLLQRVSASLKSHHQAQERLSHTPHLNIFFRAVEISTFTVIRCFGGRN